MKLLTLYIAIFLTAIGCQTAPIHNSASVAAKATPNQFTGDDNRMVLVPPSAQSEYSDPELPITKRAKLRDQLFAAAQMVVDKTHDDEAAKVLDFLRENASLCEPVGSPDQGRRVRIKEPSDGRFWFGLVPVVASDGKLGDDWRPLFESRDRGMAFAVFQPDDKKMIVRFDHEVSPYLLGVYFLHEGHHAMDFLPSPYDWENQQTFCEKERDVHLFQNRLVAKLGGKRYSNFVQSQARQMRTALEKKGTLGKEYPTVRDYPPLYRIFGQPKSTFERDALCTAVWVDIVFHMIDDQGKTKEDADYTKGIFLYNVYLQGGVIAKP